MFVYGFGKLLSSLNLVVIVDYLILLFYQEIRCLFCVALCERTYCVLIVVKRARFVKCVDRQLNRHAQKSCKTRRNTKQPDKKVQKATSATMLLHIVTRAYKYQSSPRHSWQYGFG